MAEEQPSPPLGILLLVVEVLFHHNVMQSLVVLPKRGTVEVALEKLSNDRIFRYLANQPQAPKWPDLHHP